MATKVTRVGHWAEVGRTFGIVAALSVGAAVTVAWFADGSSFVWPLSIAGGIAMVVFAIIGNVRRHYHEQR